MNIHEHLLHLLRVFFLNGTKYVNQLVILSPRLTKHSIKAHPLQNFGIFCLFIFSWNFLTYLMSPWISGVIKHFPIFKVSPSIAMTLETWQEVVSPINILHRCNYPIKCILHTVFKVTNELLLKPFVFHRKIIYLLFHLVYATCHYSWFRISYFYCFSFCQKAFGFIFCMWLLYDFFFKAMNM